MTEKLTILCFIALSFYCITPLFFVFFLDDFFFIFKSRKKVDFWCFLFHRSSSWFARRRLTATATVPAPVTPTDLPRGVWPRMWAYPSPPTPRTRPPASPTHTSWLPSSKPFWRPTRVSCWAIIMTPAGYGLNHPADLWWLQRPISHCLPRRHTGSPSQVHRRSIFLRRIRILLNHFFIIEIVLFFLDI